MWGFDFPDFYNNSKSADYTSIPVQYPVRNGSRLAI